VDHMSAAGNRDAARRRILIFDVDPFLPAPYEVLIDVLPAMQTRDDGTGEPLGSLVVRTSADR
jgi:hypothetical protein